MWCRCAKRLQISLFVKPLLKNNLTKFSTSLISAQRTDVLTSVLWSDSLKLWVYSWISTLQIFFSGALILWVCKKSVHVLHCFQDLEDDEYDVRKPKKQRRSIVRTPSITRVRDTWELQQVQLKSAETSFIGRLLVHLTGTVSIDKHFSCRGNKKNNDKMIEFLNKNIKQNTPTKKEH